MIPYDLEYYLPETVDDALALFAEFDNAGKEPLYYAGGTEIITLCRQQVIAPKVLIDIKALAETNQFDFDNDQLIVGANLDLTTLSEQEDYPQLARVAREIADHTVRNRLTLGGNICGSLPYREALLPFLIAGAEAVLASPDGIRREPLDRLFDKRLRLNKGELLLQLAVKREELGYYGISRRRERHGPVDYPLCHLVASKKKENIALAVSGLCAYPFRSEELEIIINDRSLGMQERAEKSIAALPGTIRSDEIASDDYRRALWIKDLNQLLGEMEGAG